MNQLARFRVFGLVVFLFACSGGAVREEKPAGVPTPVTEDYFENSENARYSPVMGMKGMVVADDAIAAEWGVEILRRGGNAIDAAVATAFAMSATRPHYASLGGGGFLVYCPAPKDGKPSDCMTLDYRETAPAQATRDMYLKDGKPMPKASVEGALASGVPGVTAGLLAAHERFGSRSRAELLSKPIALARDGFRMTGNMEEGASNKWDVFNDEGKRIFGCAAPRSVVLPTRPCRVGQTLRQKDLARVLEAIRERGASGFYGGWVARAIASSLQRAGGILTEKDLASYRPKWRKPVSGFFKGYEIVSMPPPSSGGGLLVQLLGYAERADREGAFSGGFGSSQAIHALAYGMSLAYADRAKYYGDSDFFEVPVEKMLDPAYLDSRWKTFNPKKARIADGAGTFPRKEGDHTTHFSVIDRHGNAVAITTTINSSWGSRFVAEGTGVLMNNEMDDFSMQPGVPNLYGLVGAEANAIAPGKRPLSSMTPTIVRDAAGNARIVLGAAGGSRIPTTVFQILMNRLQFHMPLVDAVTAHRIHHQWKPENLQLEKNGFGPETIQALRGLGYTVKEITGSGWAQALERFPASGRVWGVPDLRTEGSAAAE